MASQRVRDLVPCHCFPGPALLRRRHLPPTPPVPLPALHSLCSPKGLCQRGSRPRRKASFCCARPRLTCTGPGRGPGPSAPSPALVGRSDVALVLLSLRGIQDLDPSTGENGSSPKSRAFYLVPVFLGEELGTGFPKLDPPDWQHFLHI